MSKTLKMKHQDLQKGIMAKVRAKEIVMKPRWNFVVGSILSFLSLVGLSIGAVFTSHLSLFLLRSRSPMKELRLEQMLSTFPWWIPALAIIGVILGIWLLKNYDFSYKKNFRLIAVSFIFAIILATVALDYLGFNSFWQRQGSMRRYYQQQNNTEPTTFPKGQGGMRQQKIWLKEN